MNKKLLGFLLMTPFFGLIIGMVVYALRELPARQVLWGLGFGLVALLVSAAFALGMVVLDE